MSYSISVIKEPTETNPKMWSSKHSIYGRTFGALRSAQQKYARRGMTEKLVQVSLEIAASQCPRAAYDYMSTILVEDKFPEGANYIFNHKMVLKDFKKMTYERQIKEITQMAYILSKIPSDRHACCLARVAMKLAREGNEPNDPEEKMAYEAEKIILRIPKKNELPTPNDYTVEEGMNKLKELLFKNIIHNRDNDALFKGFKDNWVKSAKSTPRLYVYNLVGRNFHDHRRRTQIINMEPPAMKMVDLDDFVYDKHTLEGKKRKRGLNHFLTEGAHIENPARGIHDRSGTKRKAYKDALDSEAIYGTKGSKSSAERKRLRSTFLELKSIKGKDIVSSKACQKPCGGKPRTIIAKTVDNKDFFIKGPYRDTTRIEFQSYIDTRKKEYGIIPMDIEIVKEGKLYYLVAPVKEGFVNMSPAKLYNDEILWNLIKVLIFRAAFNISDTNLRNVMVNFSTNEVLSVDEMTPNRMMPRARGLIFMLFNKAPRKMFAAQVMGIIRNKATDFWDEVRKYGESAKHLRV